MVKKIIHDLSYTDMVLVIPAHNSPQNHTLHHEGRVGLRDFGLRRELIRCWCYTSEARYNIHIGSGLLNHKSHNH